MAKAYRAAYRRIGTTFVIAAALMLGTFLVYYFSNPHSQSFYDYTFRVAQRMLEGHVGLTVQPPSWLNEFVPMNNNWYSVFPLGSVLVMVPFVVIGRLVSVSTMPAALIAGLQAAFISLFLFLISLRYDLYWFKRVMLVLAIVLGTWMWTNVTFGGAWQLALGFAMFGQVVAIYFSMYRPKPVLAGTFFALAFGNRTEILLTTPILLYLLLNSTTVGFQGTRLRSYFNKQSLKVVAGFCIIPLLLGISTLIYNNVRFGSPLDFGYARIPGVLEEPWYNHGIFSASYIPRQASDMLLKSWQKVSQFPYRKPEGFGSSILLSSPFLLLLFRSKMKSRAVVFSSWIAVTILTLSLWVHGNSGGWQFGYRYAMVLLPWFFILLLENSPKKVQKLELVLFLFSILANGYATYLFHWTKVITP